MKIRNFCITAGGGLGDQICAEPIIRWMTNSFYKKDNIVVMTQYPEIFSHLPVESVCKNNLPLNKSWVVVKTHATQEDKDSFCFHKMHPVDYIMLRLFRRQLKNNEKEVHLEYSNENKEKVLDLIGDYKKAILIHAGVSWKSKTFPREIWQEYIDILKEKYKVILIGKHIKKDEALNIKAEAGYVKVNPEGCLDLRDKLSIKDLFALIDICKLLISNDSGPVHIAGAFDNWIGMIPSCKHPDYIFPYRKGSQLYKTKALWKKDISSTFDFDPLSFYDVPLGDISKEVLKEGLPLKEDIFDFVKGIL